MPRILHVTQPVEAGVPAVVAMLVDDQRARGWDVTVACPDGPLDAGLRAAGVPVEPWAAGRSPDHRVPGEARALRRIVGRVAPDVVHLHSAKAGMAGRLALRGSRPTLFQPHGWSFDAVRDPVATVARHWERIAGRWTDLLVCVSDDELAAARAAGLRCPSVVVPNGVDTGHLRPRDRAAARAAAGLPGGPLALCVGRLAEQKGQDLLLAAWPGVLARVPDARLALVGDGPERAHLRRLPGAVDASVHWIGAVADPADHYAAADVVVAPSRWEGMALVPLEAMASGRSVVASDVTGMRESLGTGTGAVLPPGDVGALTDALVRRLAEPGLADAEGAAGRLRAAAGFDRRRAADAVAAEVLGLLRAAVRIRS